MTTNLKYSLTANSTGVGVNHSTNETFEFNTGDACETDGSCIMNGNTVMTERSTNSGYYYSWYTATAGTGTASMTSGDAIGSICPKGWRLPADYAVDSAKSYGSLAQAYLGFSSNTAIDSTSILESVPLTFLRPGCYTAGAISLPNVSAYYWSATAWATTTDSFDFHYDARFTGPRYANAKFFGNSVRCVSI